MYGEPAISDKLQADLDAGRAHLGGCVIDFDDPNRHCNDCGAEWSTKTKNKYQDIDEKLITVILPITRNE